MDPATSALSAHTGSTLMVVGTMQWLKKASWFPLLKDGQKVMNRTISIIAALFVQVGISYTYTTAADGTHQFSMMIPTYTALAIGLFHWGSQYLYQETGYTFLSGILAIRDNAARLADIFAHMQNVTDSRTDAVQVEAVKPPKP